MTLLSRRHTNRAFEALLDNWLQILGAVGAAAATTALLGFQLWSLVPNLSSTEQATAALGTPLSALLSNPLHLPLRLLLWITARLPHAGPVLAARLPVAAMACVAMAAFVYILRRWYGPRSAAFGFALFASSAYFLHVGRFAGTDIEYLLAVLLLLAAQVSLYDHSGNPAVLFGWLAINIILLFIPGAAWFVILGAAWQLPALTAGWRQLNIISRIGWMLLALAGVGTAAASVVHSPYLWRQWLGLPEKIAQPRIVALNAARTLGALVYHSPANPELWLGRLPVLDIFVATMVLAGIIFYARHWRATRTQLLAGYFIIGTVLIALHGPVRLAFIIPIVYLVAVAGIAYVLHFWLKTFPRNRLARATGISIVAAVVAISCIYNLRAYFIAWPHNPDTAAAYHYHLR